LWSYSSEAGQVGRIGKTGKRRKDGGRQKGEGKRGVPALDIPLARRDKVRKGPLVVHIVTVATAVSPVGVVDDLYSKQGCQREGQSRRAEEEEEEGGAPWCTT
jgi:hypothetical protein